MLAVLTIFTLSLGFAPSAQAMTACEARLPTIERVGLREKTPAGVVLEAQVNPQNSTTTYEFVIVQQLRNPENPSERGELTPEGPRTMGGPIPASAGDVTVSGLVTDLQPGYIYWYEVIATNLAGETRSDGDNWFSYYYTGGYTLLPGAPFRAVPPSPCAIELAQQEAGRIAAKTEAERQQQSREHEELLAKETAVRYASEAASLKRREEGEAAAQAASSLSLTATSITVQSDDMALVKLNCLGIATCHGKLSLTARVTSKTKGKKRRSRATTIGTVGFAIAGDQTKTVKVDLDAAGRALFKAGHGRCGASLALLELAPGSKSRKLTTVLLV